MPFQKGNRYGALRKNKAQSEEAKKKISVSVSKTLIGNKRRLGTTHSEETRRKMSEARSRRPKMSKEARNWQKNKRNRMKRANGGSHTFGQWETLKAQYNWTCPCCKKSEPEIRLTEDHIIPVSKGGTDNIENIQPLCLKCNIRKHTQVVKYSVE